MNVKITNCTVKNYRCKTRRNQNIHIEVDDRLFYEYTAEEIVIMLLKGQITYSDDFIVTTSSKIILPQIHKEPETKEDIRLKKLESL